MAHRRKIVWVIAPLIALLLCAAALFWLQSPADDQRFVGEWNIIYTIGGEPTPFNGHISLYAGGTGRRWSEPDKSDVATFHWRFSGPELIWRDDMDLIEIAAVVREDRAAALGALMDDRWLLKNFSPERIELVEVNGSKSAGETFTIVLTPAKP